MMSPIEHTNNDEQAIRLDNIRHNNIIARLWQKDYTVWKKEPDEISNRLGWLDVAGTMQAKIPELEAFAKEVIAAGFHHVVLLGMGGSSLGPEVLRQTFGSAPGYPELIVLDSTLPEVIQAVTEQIEPSRTLFLISSKSGTTTEPLTLFAYFKELLAKSVSQDKTGEHFITVTDPGTPLAKLGKASGFRRVFINPSDIGGRYSILSYFGLVPAVLIGIDLRKLIERALNMSKLCAPDMPIEQNPGTVLGIFMGAMTKCGRDKLTLFTSPSISSLGLWIEQLLAESTGKQGTGIVPVAMEPIFDTECYGNDRMFVYLRISGDDNTATDEAVAQIESSGQPLMTIQLNDRYDLAAEFFRWEFATAVAGYILGIQPFDQPDVQKAKDATNQILLEYTESGQLPSAASKGTLQNLLSQAVAGSYLAIMAYLPQTADIDQALTNLRRTITEKYKIATTLGYGPRFLHSTGQLHKGGPGSGLFLQITTEHVIQLPVPEKPYTFAVIADAQALGDLKALQSLGRQIVNARLEQSTAKSLYRIIAGLT